VRACRTGGGETGFDRIGRLPCGWKLLHNSRNRCFVLRTWHFFRIAYSINHGSPRCTHHQYAIDSLCKSIVLILRTWHRFTQGHIVNILNAHEHIPVEETYFEEMHASLHTTKCLTRAACRGILEPASRAPASAPIDMALSGAANVFL